MKLVSDSSVLIHLARAGYFYLWRSLYGELLIPTAVYSEVVERGWGFPGSSETEGALKEGWLEVRSATDKVRVTDLTRTYGISLGNAETVQLAVEEGAEVALADEVEVRDLLEKYGVKVRGCIGVFIEATKRGGMNTEEAKNAIRTLVETGYRVGNNVLNEAYQLLREQK